MKSRLQKIEIQNFKAFRQFSLNLEGRHLLLYGPNGSGKSSLYWALYTFLQSAKKPTPQVAKYFDPTGDQKLLNLNENPVTVLGEIAMTLRDAVTKNDTTYRISHADHDTRNQPPILKGDLASDFITYRFFFGFSNFRNSEKFDLWSLLRKEVLPFCVPAGELKSLADIWNDLVQEIETPVDRKGGAAKKAYDEFDQKLVSMNSWLAAKLSEITTAAQKFYDRHFSEGDVHQFEFGVVTSQGAAFDRKTKSVMVPRIGFELKVDGQRIPKPQTYLNEAKLTQLALSVRFAASMVNLHESDLKLLVLDDLLVSLDMDNRMKVVEILLSETFGNYQKIILTHDRGFFHEFRRTIGSRHPEWCFYRLEGTAADQITPKVEKTDIQKAEDYLHGHNLDEAALCLRKACEDTAKRFVDQDEVVPTKAFVGLAESLRAARNRVLAELPAQLYETVIRCAPEAHLDLLIPSTDDDLDNNAALDAPTKGRLKTSRRRLRQLVTSDHVERLRQAKLIDDILACTQRVLNPAAHAGNPPLYEQEVQDALTLVTQLEATLHTT